MDDLINQFDFNLSTLIDFSFFNVVKIGLGLGVFKELDKTKTLEDILNLIDVKNKLYLRSLLSTYYDLGILEATGTELSPKRFLRTFTLEYERLRDIIPEWINIQDEIVRMANYAFLSFENSKVMMDFDKDSDFWDIRLSNPLNKLYREIIVRAGGLRDGMRVLDLGCGSVSPIELGKHVGPNGEYVGIDFSPGLLSIAQQRVRELGMDWVFLRELDITNAIPKRKYDRVIMSFVLEYLPEVHRIIIKALNFVDEGGKLIIVEPFRENFENIAAWEFFEKLTKEFRRFPKKSEILDALEYYGRDAKISEYGKSVLVLEPIL